MIATDAFVSVQKLGIDGYTYHLANLVWSSLEYGSADSVSCAETSAAPTLPLNPADVSGRV